MARDRARSPRGCRRVPRRQRGAALLLLLALLLTVGAGLLLEQLNERALLPGGDDGASAVALARAKTALIAFAVTHPGTPGQLPFPDRSADGSFDGVSDCVNVGTTVVPSHLVGRFPWRGDESPGSGCLASIPDWPLAEELVDGSASGLWYAVSDRLVFNGNGGPINPGLLDPGASGSWLTVVDAAHNVISDRVAAVIIAPGEVGECQDRDLPIGDPAYPAQFLDRVTVGAVTQSNADADGVFVTAPRETLDPGETCADAPAPSTINDRLVYITADELMDAVQKRVAGEVAAVLQRYRAVPGRDRYPWLGTFLPPDSSAYVTAFGQTTGQLAFTDTANGEPDFDHDSALAVTWVAGDADIDGPDVTITSSDPSLVVVTENDATDLENDSPHFYLESAPGGLMSGQANLVVQGSSASVPYPTTAGTGATCTWSGDNLKVRCTGTAVPASTYGVRVCRHDLDFSALGFVPPIQSGCTAAAIPVTREVEFDLNFDGDSVTYGSDARVRVRTVSDVDGVMTVVGPDTLITVTDTVVWAAVPPFFFDTGTIRITWTLRIKDGDSSQVTAGNVYTEIQSPGPGGPEDLPRWFADNQWARFIQVAYAPAFAPTGGGTCTAGSDCLSLAVNGIAGAETRAEAAVAVSGALIGTQTRSGATPTAAGFEDGNADADPLSVERKPRSATFNDRVTLVDCTFSTPPLCR